MLRDGRHIGTIPVAEATPEVITNMMIGSDWQKSHWHRHEQTGEVKLAVRNLSRGDFLKDISFDLHEGEVLGFAGLLGSGRSELLRCIFGLDPMDSGEIWVKGERITNPSPLMMKQHHIGMTPEDRKHDGLVLVFSVRDNLTLASLDSLTKNGLLQRGRAQEMAEEMVTGMDIKTANLEVATQNLSGGNQQKVVIGNWLNTRPEILLMDEPSRGIDIQAKEQIFELVRELASQKMAVLFVSSELEEVLDVSDRILVINQGRITYEAKHDEINLEQLMSLAMEEAEHV